MDALDISRWQFAITTVYHYIFVPLTIGLAPLVAIMQTAWVRTGKEHWLRLTKFFGKLFLINFAIGVVTGIVQEFQFGMNWSEYSEFVGDVFGVPLAFEALLAFFLESVFIGLWIFGWDRLSKRVHLASIWLAALGVNLSAYFIIAANSFMQHPVGVTYDAATGRAQMADPLAVLTNSTTLAAFPHTVTGAFLVAGTFVAGIGGWWTVRHARAGRAEEAAVYRPALRTGLVVIVLAGIGVAVSGDSQAQLMFQQQPMKMAAAEALCESETGAGFSIFAYGDVQTGCDDVTTLTVPGLTSFLATHTFDSTLQGVNDLQAEYEAKYGAGSYIPMLPVTYWSFRLMMGFAVFSAALALAGLWLTRGGRTPDAGWFGKLCLVSLPMPFLANLTGWIFTEVGRQPWLVAPNPTGDADVHLTTAAGVSPYNDALTVGLSLVVFTLLYGVLAVVWFKLVRGYTAAGAPEVSEPTAKDDDAPLAFAY